MGKFKKVCAAIGGAAIISAAIMGMVSASTTGLNGIDKGFIYDANYNPHVQIVVGEKAAAADVVGAGDIAATIGNLAYTSCAGGGGSAGEVKLSSKSWEMIGKYEQDISGRSVGTTNLEGTFLSSTPYGSFFKTEGQRLANGPLEYKHGMLKNYNIGCAVNKEVANFPMKETNCNEVCYLCYDICQEKIKHPDHEMEESIIVDGNKVKYYEDGLECDSKAEALKMKLECGALRYKVTLGGIPTDSITDGGDLIDSVYRGKMLFMGSNEYFVNDLSKNYIVLAKGEKLKISSAGYTEPKLSELQGYRFKLLKVIDSGGKAAGVIIEVEKPDGTTSEVQASKMGGALLGKDEKGHQVEIQAFQVMGNTAEIIAYDMSTQTKLENNKKIGDWRVKIEKEKCNKVGVEEYGTSSEPVGNADKKSCLTELTLTYEGDATLNVGDTVYFPTNAVKFSFEGFKDEDFGDIKCSGGDDKIKIATEGDHKVLLSFTTRDGQRMNNVRLDEGPYEVDELFLIGNTVYKLREAEESSDGSELTLKLTDVTNANDFEAKIPKRNGDLAGFDYVKFKDDDTNKADGCSSPCTTYNGTVLGVMAYYHGGRLWMDKGKDNIIGLNDIDLTDIQSDDCPAELKTLFEDGTDKNGEGEKNNTDDEILVFKGCGKDEIYIDFYDRNSKGKKATSVKITGPGGGPVNTSCLSSDIVCSDCYNKSSVGFPGVLYCSEDTKLWSPRGADLFTVTSYGSSAQVKGVEICHPTKKAYITYFLGKEKKESEMVGTITADDVGKLKTIGCCELTVKSFGLSSNATGTCQSVKSVGKLMVLDKDVSAGTNKNLIVVGGPAVNTIAASAGVTRDEIKADADKYVIKLVNNNTLVVAGWEAEDTRKATDKVVDWLLANAH